MSWNICCNVWGIEYNSIQIIYITIQQGNFLAPFPIYIPGGKYGCSQRIVDDQCLISSFFSSNRNMLIKKNFLSAAVLLCILYFIFSEILYFLHIWHQVPRSILWGGCALFRSVEKLKKKSSFMSIFAYFGGLFSLKYRISSKYGTKFRDQFFFWECLI